MNTPGSGVAHEYERMNIKHGVDTASPHRLIQMMMDRVLAKIAIAQGHMEREAVSEKGRCISDAIGLISGLQASLNHKADDKLGGNFDALYHYMTRRLLEANLNDDPDILKEVSGLMRELKEAWDAIGGHLNPSDSAAAAD